MAVSSARAAAATAGRSEGPQTAIQRVVATSEARLREARGREHQLISAYAPAERREPKKKRKPPRPQPQPQPHQPSAAALAGVSVVGREPNDRSFSCCHTIWGSAPASEPGARAAVQKQRASEHEHQLAGRSSSAAGKRAPKARAPTPAPASNFERRVESRAAREAERRAAMMARQERRAQMATAAVHRTTGETRESRLGGSSARDGDARHGSSIRRSGATYPPALKAWIVRSLGEVEDPLVSRKIQLVIKATIAHAGRAGTIWQTDWDAEPAIDPNTIPDSILSRVDSEVAAKRGVVDSTSKSSALVHAPVLEEAETMAPSDTGRRLGSKHRHQESTVAPPPPPSVSEGTVGLHDRMPHSDAARMVAQLAESRIAALVEGGGERLCDGATSGAGSLCSGSAPGAALVEGGGERLCDGATSGAESLWSGSSSEARSAAAAQVAAAVAAMSRVERIAALGPSSPARASCEAAAVQQAAKAAAARDEAHGESSQPAVRCYASIQDDSKEVLDECSAQKVELVVREGQRREAAATRNVAANASPAARESTSGERTATGYLSRGRDSARCPPTLFDAASVRSAVPAAAQSGHAEQANDHHNASGSDQDDGSGEIRTSPRTELRLRRQSAAAARAGRLEEQPASLAATSPNAAAAAEAVVTSRVAARRLTEQARVQALTSEIALAPMAASAVMDAAGNSQPPAPIVRPSPVTEEAVSRSYLRPGYAGSSELDVEEIESIEAVSIQPGRVRRRDVMRCETWGAQETRQFGMGALVAGTACVGISCAVDEDEGVVGVACARSTTGYGDPDASGLEVAGVPATLSSVPARGTTLRHCNSSTQPADECSRSRGADPMAAPALTAPTDTAASPACSQPAVSSSADRRPTPLPTAPAVRQRPSSAGNRRTANVIEQPMGRASLSVGGTNGLGPSMTADASVMEAARADGSGQLHAARERLARLGLASCGSTGSFNTSWASAVDRPRTIGGESWQWPWAQPDSAASASAFNRVRPSLARPGVVPRPRVRPASAGTRRNGWGRMGTSGELSIGAGRESAAGSSGGRMFHALSAEGGAPDWKREERELELLLSALGNGRPLTATMTEPCCICLEGMCAGNLAMTLPCSHVFHSACIMKWLHKTQNCPLCKDDTLRSLGGIP